MWEEHLKGPNHSLGNSITVPGEPLLGLAIGSKRKVVRTAAACSDVGTKILQEMLEGTSWEGVWPCLDPWDSVRLPIGTSRGSMGRMASSFSSLSRRSWWWLQTDVSSNFLCPCGNAQGVCAAGDAGSSGGQSPV